MIAMQYKIILPDSYDMNIIHQRVKNNGFKTDGFQDLLFKAYLISKKCNNSYSQNEYSPLYLWKSNNGMNKFIFEGFFDNILKSFGKQKISINVPLIVDLSANFSKSKFVVENEKDIEIKQQMKAPNFTLDNETCTGKILIYNPNSWKYNEYYFYEFMPNNMLQMKSYEILHLSM